MKRGTDHVWEQISYKADMGLYVRCKCGFRYCVGSAIQIESEKKHIYI